MSAQVSFSQLQPGLAFGSRVHGVTRENLNDEAVRARLRREFEERGVLVFEDSEQSSEMQLALSTVFGPLKDHPVAEVARADEDHAKGIIDLHSGPDFDLTILEIDGNERHSWLPWHFDHAYNNELNRAGVLRPVVIAPEDGMTGFACGIALYNSLPRELREKAEGVHVLYCLPHLVKNMKFGRPRSFVEIRTSVAEEDMINQQPRWRRSVHPAVWTRPTGEKVLHVSLLHADAIEGREDREGDALLEEICQAINANAQAYFHRWQPGTMLIWDNWRVLHCVTGTDPKYPRRLFRTTIQGDYGLGCFEGDARQEAATEAVS
jgi:taurine dioxygenase